jgi:aspartyl aminopeptidase
LNNNDSDQWKLEAGQGYFFTRNNSTLVAFNIGKKAATEGVSMFKIVGCHTDSPVLKLAPVSKTGDRAGFQ